MGNCIRCPSKERSQNSIVQEPQATAAAGAGAPGTATSGVGGPQPERQSHAAELAVRLLASLAALAAERQTHVQPPGQLPNVIWTGVSTKVKGKVKMELLSQALSRLEQEEDEFMRTAPRVTLGTPEMVDVVYQGKLIPWVWVENEEVINYALDEQQPPRQEGKGNWKAIKDVFPTERGTYTILVAVPDADPMDSNNQTQWIPVYYGSAAGEQGIQGRMASYIHMPTSTFLTKDKFKYHSFRALQERGFSIRIRYRAVYLEQVANLIQTLEESYVIPNLNFPLNDKRSSGHHRLPHIPYRTKPGVREWELRGLGDFELKFNNLHEIAEPPTKPAGFDDNVSRKSEHRKYMEA